MRRKDVMWVLAAMSQKLFVSQMKNKQIRRKTSAWTFQGCRLIQYPTLNGQQAMMMKDETVC